MKCLLWWVRDGVFDEVELKSPAGLARRFQSLVMDERVSVVMAEVHKQLPNSEVLTQ